VIALTIAVIVDKAAVEAKVSIERLPIHALTPANFLISFRRDAARAARASRVFSKASLTFSAPVMSWGSRESHNIPSLLGFLKSEDDFPIAHGVLLHRNWDIAQTPGTSIALRRRHHASATLEHQNTNATSAGWRIGGRDRRTSFFARVRHLMDEKRIASSINGTASRAMLPVAGSSPAGGAGSDRQSARFAGACFFCSAGSCDYLPAKNSIILPP
jgi:hypothetical protein